MPEETDRLTSWKQIAAYLEKSERTVRRWYETEGLPVHKHQHSQRGSVWAYTGEIDAWRDQRRVSPPLAEDPVIDPPPVELQNAPAARRQTLPLTILVPAILILALLCGGAMWFFRDRFSPGATAIPKAVPLTALPGREFGATFSPDGSQVAFFWTGQRAGFSGGMGIFLKTVGSEDVTPLVLGNGRFPYSPAWSPDGKTIAFLSRTEARETWLCLVASSGGPERCLTRLHDSEVLSAENQHLVWSLDSQRILAPFQTGGRQWALHWIPVSGGSTQRVTDAADSTKAPAASPDRRAIVYLQDFPGDLGGRQALMLQKLKSDGTADGSPQQLRRGPGFISGMAWLPNGEELVVCQAESGYNATRLYRMPALLDGKATALPVEGCSSVAVSVPDAAGKVRLAYGQMRDANVQLWKAPLDDLSHAGRFAPSSRTDSYPNFSPDGQRVAFRSTRSGEPAVWIVNQDGTLPRRLSDLAPLEGPIEWSPDGSQILFGAEHVGLAVVPLTGGSPAMLAAADILPSWPHWSHIDGLIYYVSAYRLFQIHADGSGRAELSDRGHPPFTSVPAMRTSPDGKVLFLTRDAALFRRTATAADSAEEVVEPQLLTPAIATTRTALYYFRREDKALYALPFAGGSARKIGVVSPALSLNLFTISPDDRTIIWGVGTLGEIDLEFIPGFR